MGKRTTQKDAIKDITSDSQVNSYFPYRWSPASLTFLKHVFLPIFIFIYNKNNGKYRHSNFIAGRPKAALQFWFFGGFRCGVPLFIVMLVIH